jgi:DinB family protein
MSPQDVMKKALEGARSVTTMLLNDMSDDDLLVRPAPNANHIAWQLGHLIRAEHGMISALPHSDMPPLPSPFKDYHAEANSRSDDRRHFASKAYYLDLYGKVRQAPYSTLSRLSLSELGLPGPESVRNFAPTIADVIILQGNHELMHAGQFTVVRRKLGKPVAF